MTAAASALPWAGMPNVSCSLSRMANGDVIGRCVVNLPQGGEPIVIQAKGNERDVMRALMARYAPDIQKAKASGMGHAGLFGFLKKIWKTAKKIVKSKIVGKLIGGFKKIMKIPILGPALGVAIPGLGMSYLALKGAEKLGLSPFQAKKLSKIKNPVTRKAIMAKLRGRAAWLNRNRWRKAKLAAMQKRRRRPLTPKQVRYRKALRGMYLRAQLRKLKGTAAGDAAVAGAAKKAIAVSERLLQRSRTGDPKARREIAQINHQAEKGDPNAIRGRRILLECAKSSDKDPKYGAGSPVYDISGDQPGMYKYGAGSPVYDISGSADTELDSLLNSEDGEDGSIAGGWDLNAGNPAVYSDEDNAAYQNAQAAGLNPQSPMSLHNYYTIMGHEPPAATAGSPFYSIGAAPTHTHQVPMPDYHCTPQPATVETSAAGHHTAGYSYGDPNLLLVTGNDGKQYQKTWNGIRWVWSELRPHLGIRSETQGFGMRDALLLGMQKIQSRELQS